jgi:hypothetical protein
MPDKNNTNPQEWLKSEAEVKQKAEEEQLAQSSN